MSACATSRRASRENDRTMRRAAAASDLIEAFEIAGLATQERERFIQNVLQSPPPSKPGRQALYEALKAARGGVNGG